MARVMDTHVASRQSAADFVALPMSQSPSSGTAFEAQGLIDRAPNFFSLVQGLRSFLQSCVVDPSVRTYILLKDLSDSIIYRCYGRCYAVFDELVRNGIKDDVTAATVLKFLLRACSAILFDCTSDAVDTMIAFSEKLSIRFSNHQLWKAYVLSLMALALPLPDAQEKLSKLRQLNNHMLLAETATMRPAKFSGLPMDCHELVSCGLALQVCMDVSQLDNTIMLSDVLELADSLFSFYYNRFSSAFLERGLQLYLERGVHLVEEALQRCHDDNAGSQAGILARTIVEVVDRGEGVLSDDLTTSALSLFTKLLMRLSFSELVRQGARLILQNGKSSQLRPMLAPFRVLVMNNWPSTPNADEVLVLKELADLVEHLLTWEDISIFQTDEKEEIAKLGFRRSFWEQLNIVAMAVNIYLVIAWKEVQGGSDHTGLLNRADDVKRWLNRLLEQKVDASPPNEDELDLTYKIIRYAVRVTDMPRLVHELGLPGT